MALAFRLSAKPSGQASCLFPVYYSMRGYSKHCLPDQVVWPTATPFKYLNQEACHVGQSANYPVLRLTLLHALLPLRYKGISNVCLVERSAMMGQRLEVLLRKKVSPLLLIGDIRGRGLFWAVEFVLDKDLKTAFPPDVNFCPRVVKNSPDPGLNTLGNLGHTGECQVDHVRVCPPYTVTGREIEEIVTLLKNAINMTSQPFLKDKDWNGAI